MREKFFNWTAKDVADWEKIRRRGLQHFILWYGALFGGVLFVLIGGVVTVMAWNKAQAISLIPELIFIALVCLLGGLVNSLITWAMEEKLYVKFKKIHNLESSGSG